MGVALFLAGVQSRLLLPTLRQSLIAHCSIRLVASVSGSGSSGGRSVANSASLELMAQWGRVMGSSGDVQALRTLAPEGTDMKPRPEDEGGRSPDWTGWSGAGRGCEVPPGAREEKDPRNLGAGRWGSNLSSNG